MDDRAIDGAEDIDDRRRRAATWQALSRDRLSLAVLVVLAAGAVAFVAAGSGVLPDPAPLLVILLSVLVVVLLRQGARRLRLHEEQRFWEDLTVGFLSWLGALVLDELTAPPWPNVLLISVHLLQAVFYAALILALDQRPDVRHRWRAPALERAMAWPLALYLVGGVFIYCVLVPSAMRLPAARTALPGNALNVVLASYVGLRLAGLYRGTSESRWRVLYGILCLAVLLLGGHHLAALAAALFSDTGSGTVLGGAETLVTGRGAFALVALASLVLFVLAIRLRWLLPPPERSSLHDKVKTAERLAAPPEKTLATLVTMAGMHLVFTAAGVFGNALRPYHDRFVLAWCVLGGVLVLAQHFLWRGRTEHLRREMRRTERSLHQIERKLALRKENPRGPLGTLSEDDLARVLDACPEMIALSKYIDGSFREVNPACYDLLGWEVEEMLGRTPRELSIWLRPRDRLAMIQHLSEGREVLDLEIALRTRKGTPRVGRLSGRLVEVGGQPCLVMVLRDGSGRRAVSAVLEQARSLLDGAAEGISLVAADDRLLYCNPAAARLFGGSAESVDDVVGRSVADLVDGGAWLDGIHTVRTAGRDERVVSRSVAVEGAGGSLRLVVSAFSGTGGEP